MHARPRHCHAAKRSPALPHDGGGRRPSGGLTWRRTTTRRRRCGRSSLNARERGDGATRVRTGRKSRRAVGRGLADRRGAGRRCHAGVHGERKQACSRTGGTGGPPESASRRRKGPSETCGIGNKRTFFFSHVRCRNTTSSCKRTLDHVNETDHSTSVRVPCHSTMRVCFSVSRSAH